MSVKGEWNHKHNYCILLCYTLHQPNATCFLSPQVVTSPFPLRWSYWTLLCFHTKTWTAASKTRLFFSSSSCYFTLFDANEWKTLLANPGSVWQLLYIRCPKLIYKAFIKLFWKVNFICLSSSLDATLGLNVGARLIMHDDSPWEALSCQRFLLDFSSAEPSCKITSDTCVYRQPCSVFQGYLNMRRVIIRRKKNHDCW